ncbi:adenine phosphoribosyltransferase [Halostagnicola sp. A56]|uniref:hypoxanthine/guanine phosphoribosyltransferase n=1 Tax=Halostagnicola sp. A56 TaxID=1495067 RepID=UPI0004A0CFA1|nr:hypoxanthine/guanine phosphoribosyltransferase [Halostagnicola sp. A56]KDE59301.1 adenine phosphoribosyltransferase [Halostagnicola sp. A56]
MEQLERSVHDAPIIEKDDYEYLVHPISNCVPVLEPSLLREVVTRIVRAADLENVDKIVTPAAMGIHISTAVSLTTDIPLVVIRKREYGLEGEVSLTQETGYSKSEMYINDVDQDDNVLLLDDMLSTGGTLRAITEALESIGTNIVDIVVAMRKVDGGDAMVDSEYDVSSLLDIVVRDGEVTVIRDEEERQLVTEQFDE